jgi:hypothetical protein
LLHETKKAFEPFVLLLKLRYLLILKEERVELFLHLPTPSLHANEVYVRLKKVVDRMDRGTHHLENGADGIGEMNLRCNVPPDEETYVREKKEGNGENKDSQNYGKSAFQRWAS